MGAAELGAAPRRRAAAARFSDRTHPRLGVRCNTAGNPGHAPPRTSGNGLAGKGHRRRNIFLLGAAGLAAAVAAGFLILPPLTATKMDKSIAVLPFENFSEDKDNAFFADGIQDDILTNLSKIGDLKVISRPR